MNKSELVEAVASDAGVSKSQAEAVLTTFFDTVKDQLAAGDSVAWPGFGKFATTARQARVGRNPQTGESVKIAASTAARFTSSSLLKQHLNPKAKRAATRKAAASKAPAKRTTAKATASKATASKATASKASAATKKAPAKKATSTAKKAPAKRASR